MRKLVKGNEAVVLGGLSAGCDAYFGYPITPASEIAQLTAEYYLKLGKIFLQAECEVASISMIYGASATGLRTMTSSSGPGISLMQEGISYLCAAQLPAVIVDVMRVGPGIGNIGPEQTDYFQIVKGGGHGTYRLITLAPNCASEMYRMTVRAFELADRYRNPAVLLVDAILGQMMEPIELDEIPSPAVKKDWKVDTTAATNGNAVTTIFLNSEQMREHILSLQRKYDRIEEDEACAQTDRVEDAEIILTGYGIVSRILKSVVDRLRSEGVAAGLIRPQTLWPFPTKVYRQYCPAGKKVLVVELSTGQMIEDVRLAVPSAEIHFHGQVGGFLPTELEIIDKVRQILG